MDAIKKSVLFVACIFCLFMTACGSNNADVQKENVRRVGVKVAPVTKGDVTTIIQTTGTISPKRETYIGPKVGGRIEKFYVDEGDFVKKGTPLVRLEQVRFSLALEEARASHEENTAQLKNLSRKLKRKKLLFNKGILDRDAFADIETEVELARARAAMATSRLDHAKEDKKDSVLYAPFDGFVVEKKMNTGEMFSTAANEYVFHIVDTGTVEVEANVFETKKQYITFGKKVSITVDAIPEKVFTGKITVVNPFIDTFSRKFLVKIEIPNADFALESGMFARIRIPEEKSLGTLLVPANAIVEREDRKVLFVAEAETARARPVTTGLMTHETVEILTGVTEHERVIVDGLYAVKDGSPVVIEE